MSWDIHSNFGYGTVATAPDPAASGTTMVLGTATFADFPDPGTVGYNVVVWPSGTIPLSSNSEIIRVVTKGTNGTVDVTREQESTTARTITVGDQCGVAITKKVITDIETAIGSDSWVFSEIVNGTPNGTLTAFTVDNEFLANSTMVFRDGQLMNLGTAYDYTEGTGGTINFVTAPAASTNISVTYRKNLTANGNADTLDGYHANATPTVGQIPVLDSAMAMIGGGMSRQAIMNGNFDVWQRATTKTNPADGSYNVADRWIQYNSSGGGTLPTNVIHSRQALTAGDISNAFYCYRINPDGAGSSLGVSSYGAIAQKIEHGTRFLAGNGKKVTLSFWAKSDIANKRMGVALGQNYGSGGSPTSEEMITGGLFTLTSSWAKYTYTFTTNTLSGKTFGTANDDHLRAFLFVMWGTTTATTYFGGGTAETYIGSGNIDIAQVQLCAGDVALPFQPKNYEQELHDCMRYCEGIIPEVGQDYYRFGSGHNMSTTTSTNIWWFKVPKRNRSLTLTTSGTANQYAVYHGNTITACSSVPVIQGDTNQQSIYCAIIQATVASGLTAGGACQLISNGNDDSYLIINNEL